MTVVPVFLALIFLSAAAAIISTRDDQLARRYGTFSAIVAILATAILLRVTPLDASIKILGSELAIFPSGLLYIAPLVTSLVALFAFGLAPLQTHTRSTFVTMAVLFAVAQAFIATKTPAILLVLWGISSILAFVEFRKVAKPTGHQRVYGAYHLLAFALFGGGIFLTTDGVISKVGLVLLVIAIGIREASLPLHSWFMSFVSKAPMGLVIAFSAPQLGIYAQLELFDIAQLDRIASIVATFGAFTAVVAAVFGVVQIDGRRAIAYLIISQTGLIAFGLESHDVIGLTGAILNWQVLAVASSGLAMTLAMTEARRGQLRLDISSGTFAETPRLASTYLIFGFASVGFPLTLGFIAEDLLVQGTVDEFPILSLSLIVATSLNGVTVLRSFFAFFTGSRERRGTPDLFFRERMIVMITIALLLATGIAPHAFVNFETRPFAAESAAHGSGSINPPLSRKTNGTKQALERTSSTEPVMGVRR